MYIYCTWLYGCDCLSASLKAQTLLCGLVAPCGGVDNKVPQLHPTMSLDYLSVINYTITSPNLQSVKEGCSGRFRNKFNFESSCLIVFLTIFNDKNNSSICMTKVTTEFNKHNLALKDLSIQVQYQICSDNSHNPWCYGSDL